MSILFKILRIVVYAFLILVASIVAMYYLEVNESKLINGYYLDYGSGVSIKSTDNKNLFIGEVIEYVFDEKYIIVKRLPRVDYECKNYYNSSYLIRKIQYLIINTKNKSILGSFNPNKFYKKLKKLNVSVNFKLTETEIATKIKDKENWLNPTAKEINNMKRNCIIHSSVVILEL